MPLEILTIPLDEETKPDAKKTRLGAMETKPDVKIIEPGLAFVTHDYSEVERRIFAIHCSPFDNGGEFIIFPDNGALDNVQGSGIEIDNFPVPLGIVEITNDGRPYEYDMVTAQKKLSTLVTQYVVHNEVTVHGAIPKSLKHPN